MKKWIRRPIAVLLVLGLMLSVVPGAKAAVFSDVDEEHWAYTAIHHWADAGVVSGYDDGCFHPERQITRAEVAVILAGALGLQGDTTQQTFQDVPTSHWAHPYIELCAASGIFRGYGKNLFAPEQEISRQEAATVLCRAKEIHAENPMGALQSAADWYKVVAWAIPAMGTMLEYGFLKGYPDGTIRPNAQITRGEFAALLYRVATAEVIGPTDKDNSLIREVTWNGVNASVKVLQQKQVNWLFLPAGADLTNMHMDVLLRDGVEGSCIWRGDLGETAGMVLDLPKLSGAAEDGSYTLTVRVATAAETEEKTIRIVQSSNVSAVFLTSADAEGRGRDYVDAAKGNSVKGNLTYLWADGTIVYQGGLSQIKSRGNSTFVHYPKKAYQIKLENKTDLLGVGEKGKTWVLLASYGDPTQMHDKLCKDLASDMQMEGVPDCDWVDLYFDGEYRGTYLLSEKVSVGSTGLDITDLEGAYEDVNANYGDDPVTATGVNRYGNTYSYVTGLVDPDDISDGYVLELNNRQGDENCWFVTSKNYAFNIKIPEDVSAAAAAYVSEFYQEFEDAVYSENGINPETGKSYDEYCDLDSLVQMYLLYTFSNNQDAYIQSTFFYLSDGKLYAGPIWDSDQVFGTGWDLDVAPDSELKWDYLVGRLEQIPSFRAAAKAYYNSVFRALAVEYAQERVCAYRETLAGTERMNHVLWPVYYRWAGMEKVFDADVTYSGVVETMRTWMLQRIEYMDAKLK